MMMYSLLKEDCRNENRFSCRENDDPGCHVFHRFRRFHFLACRNVELLAGMGVFHCVLYLYPFRYSLLSCERPGANRAKDKNQRNAKGTKNIPINIRVRVLCGAAGYSGLGLPFFMVKRSGRHCNSVRLRSFVWFFHRVYGF
jgi:hypothetical protein